MRATYWKWMSVVSAFALAFSLVPGAAALCGPSNKLIKPSAWSPQYGIASPQFVKAGLVDYDDHEPSIVGLWHVVFTGQTMNGGSYSLPEPFDNSVVVWHGDGTEIMNSSRPAQDGNFCLGVWQQTGKRQYFLNHIPWQGNDPTGTPTGGAQMLEKVTLSPDGNSYTGKFTFQAYDINGNPSLEVSGTLTAKRITPDTPFSSLL
ncbi:hypothetical protein HNQ77_002187 [Silvibacterium bohemicum]|uniref:Uncharacterized protein n=1 Tax=Silvibacterium bohemicum TaxID=1577686 RepID=A0A841JUP1_9BACT|nr:hypothetical protein [Silvibacterium bohemicum]MBB6144235.1 hypothetical protein [Silvibacterium bohemicum]